MNVSSKTKVCELYDSTAGAYSKMMDEEINDPIYDEVLSELAIAVKNVPGAILDTSCGGGHMLKAISTKYCPGRDLIGVDLSPEMVLQAKKRLAESARVVRGDMSDLHEFADSSCSALISYFAIHHVDANELANCLFEWHRKLCVAGKLILAAWEGSGNVDYGTASDVNARRYSEDEILLSVSQAGFQIDRHFSRPVDGIEMDAVYLVGTKI